MPTTATDTHRTTADPCDLSILVVSYNTEKLTLECLESVARETSQTHYELIAIDNASTDGSAVAIADAFPNFRLIASQENLGFAQANNVAAAEARGRRILLLNPDTVVLEGAIDRIHAFAEEHPENRIWGGVTVHADHTLDPMSCWKQMTLWSLFCRATGLARVFSGSNLFNSELQPAWKRDDIREVDIVTGCFLLIDRELWDEMDGFDRDFFMYGEEADLCLRARTVGARPLHCPDAKIIHYGGASETVATDRMVKILRAKTQLVRKHWRGLARWLGVKLMAGWPLTNSLASRVLKLLGRKDEKLDVWISVWRRRREWLS